MAFSPEKTFVLGKISELQSDMGNRHIHKDSQQEEQDETLRLHWAEEMGGGRIKAVPQDTVVSWRETKH